MKTVIGSAVLASMCLMVAACDTKGTKEVKDTAKAIDESYEAQADLVEAANKNAPDNAANAAEAKADALRNQGEAIKDHLIKEAKETQKATK
jgi:gas vesicle protein